MFFQDHDALDDEQDNNAINPFSRVMLFKLNQISKINIDHVLSRPAFWYLILLKKHVSFRGSTVVQFFWICLV